MWQRLQKTVLGTSAAWVVCWGLSGCAVQKPVTFGQQAASQVSGAAPATVMPSSYAQPVAAPRPNMTAFTKADMASWSRSSAPDAYG